MSDQVLLYKFLSNLINSLLFTSKINFDCHRLSLRNKPFFTISIFKIKYASNSTLCTVAGIYLKSNKM